MRCHADFQADTVVCVRDAGFTGVLINGGSGIGPDMLPIESLVENTTIPDLMPLTTKGNRREMERRCGLLREAGVKPWLCVWGVPGPDESAGSGPAESNRFFDRRSKLEMWAKLRRTPDIFGRRKPTALSWRGNRPLCVSHPLVQEFYRELFTRLPSSYPDLEGVFYFPGDCDPEICDETCPQCRATGLDPWGVLMKHVNDIYGVLKTAGIKFYFTVWNQDHPKGPENISRFLSDLNPGIGICMTISDNYVQPRKSGNMRFNQPWSNMAEAGDLFLSTAAQAEKAGRPVMVLAEISQSEVWDPVCHNIPLPRKALRLFQNSESIKGVNAVCDFWGHRTPMISHASHAAMRAWFAEPGASTDELLRIAAADHYGLKDGSLALLNMAIECWQAFDTAVDNWALIGWFQRFSYAIGRDGARGPSYQALVPTFLQAVRKGWAFSDLTRNKTISPARFCEFQLEDRKAFLSVAAAFDQLGDALLAASLTESAGLARREARNIELVGELIASVGRTLLAAQAHADQDWSLLRKTIEEEIDARERELEISGRLGPDAGVNFIFVSEDIQNMRLYLSSDDFPHTPASYFHFTATPYSA